MFQLDKAELRDIVDSTEDMWKKPEYNLEYKKALLDMNLAASRLLILLLKDDVSSQNSKTP